MQILFELARALSIVAFLFFGITCLTTDYMVAEFQRYGLAGFRVTVGLLQLMAAVAMIAGYFYPRLLLLSSAGLTLLMLLGVVTRIRIGDTLVQTLPALSFFLINGFVLWFVLTRN